MRSLPSILLIGLLGMLPCSARSPQEPPVLRSFLERSLLDRCDVIAVARYEEEGMLSRHGIDLTAFRVERTLRGPANKRILAGAVSPLAGAFRDLEKVLFLKRIGGDSLLEYVDHVDLTAKDGPLVLATVEAYLKLGGEQHPVRKAARLRSLSLGSLDTDSEFCVRVALHELDGLLRSAPFILDGSEAGPLSNAIPRLPAAEREYAREVVKRLKRIAGVDLAGTEAAFGEGPLRESYSRLRRRFESLDDPAERLATVAEVVKLGGVRARAFCEACLMDGSKDLRIAAARFLGEFGEPGAIPALAEGLGALAVEERIVRIEAIGMIAAPGGIETLRAGLSDAATFDASLLGLARTGGAVAESLLLQAETHLRTVPGSGERLERIARYRSAAFQDEERERRRRFHAEHAR